MRLGRTRTRPAFLVPLAQVSYSRSRCMPTCLWMSEDHYLGGGPPWGARLPRFSSLIPGSAGHTWLPAFGPPFDSLLAHSSGAARQATISRQQASHSLEISSASLWLQARPLPKGHIALRSPRLGALIFWPDATAGLGGGCRGRGLAPIFCRRRRSIAVTFMARPADPVG